MDYMKLSEEVTELHFEYSKETVDFMSQVASQGEERVLLYIWKKNRAVLPGELSKELNLSSGRTSNILKTLEQKGYIVREYDKDDRRNVQTILTESGRTFIKAEYESTLRKHKEMLVQLGDEDAVEFVRLMKKVLSIMKQYL